MADAFGWADPADLSRRLGSIYSPKFIELAGEASNGVFTESNFFPNDPRPEVQSFVTKFKAKYNEEPDDFNAVAYDTIILLAAVIDKYGVDRTAIRDGLGQIKDVPSVIYGKASFRCASRGALPERARFIWSSRTASSFCGTARSRPRAEQGRRAGFDQRSEAVTAHC